MYFKKWHENVPSVTGDVEIEQRWNVNMKYAPNVGRRGPKKKIHCLVEIFLRVRFVVPLNQIEDL